MRTFYINPSQWPNPGEQCCITGQEAKHIAKVLRMQPNDRLQLIDGQGHSGEFVINSIQSSNVLCQAISTEEHPNPQGRAWLAAAYTKAARRSFMLEKTVELEAGGIWFWQAELSQSKVPDNAKEKWQAELIAGAKQSHNPWLPEIKTMVDGANQVAVAGKNFKKRFLLWEDATKEQMLTPESLSTNEDVLFVMGPEGGLSAKEVEIFCKSGFTPVSLGKRVLRWETAAVLCLGINWWLNEIKNSSASK